MSALVNKHTYLKSGQTITVDKKFVQDNLGDLVKDTDLSKFIL